MKKQGLPNLIISLVLYFGIDHWVKNHSLKERIEVPEILEPYVYDYKINIREVAWLSDEQIASFKSDFRYVAEFFKLKRLKQDLKFDDKIPAHIDAILKLLTALSGDDTYTEVLKSEGDKPKTMCEVLDRMFKKKDAEIAELKKIILIRMQNLLIRMQSWQNLKVMQRFSVNSFVRLALCRWLDS